MKLIQLYVPPDQGTVFDTLDEREIDYLRIATKEREGDLVLFPLPGEGVDEVLEDIMNLGLSDDAYTVVSDADTVTSEHFEKLRERYAEEAQDERVASEQLRDRAEELNPSWLTFIGTALLSAVVVAAGLLRNSAAAVAGAMVIAPYFGTALSISVGAVSLDRYLFANGIKHQIGGLAVSIVAAAAVGILARRLAFVSSDLLFTDIGQVSIFLTPTALSIFIAIAAGAAGALTFATAADVTLSGVAIAAAIIPSAGTVGLGIAWGDLVVVAGAGTLLVVNVLCVNAAAIITLLVLGNFPSKFTFEREFDHGAWRLAVAAVTGIILLGAVGGAVFATAQFVAYDREVHAAVNDVTDQPAYDAVDVLKVRVAFGSVRLMPSRRSVTIRLLRPSHERYPNLPAVIERAVQDRTGRNVNVHVRYVTTVVPERQHASN
ncbi:MAG: DUF389 domain-containing protein [Halanaeroarchaeum sp.]